MFKRESLVVLCSLLGGACAGSHAEEVRDARIARVDEQADQREQAVDDRAKERGKNIDQRYDERRDAVEAKNEPGEGQSKELLDLSQERAEDQSKVQARLDKVAVKLQAARQKISVLAEHAPTQLKSSLQTANTEHDTLQQELVTLRTERSQRWESDKKVLQDRVSQLEARVDQLDKDIDSAKS
jgi:predicted  nucleic acid-binding Zn-ribbon protein